SSRQRDRPRRFMPMFRSVQADIGQYREQLHEDLVGKDLQGNDTDGDHYLGKGGEVAPSIAQIEADQVDIEAVESAAEDDHCRAAKEPAGRAAILPGKEDG